MKSMHDKLFRAMGASKEKNKKEDEHWSMAVGALWTSEAWQKYVIISAFPAFPGFSLYLSKPYWQIFSLAAHFLY